MAALGVKQLMHGAVASGCLHSFLCWSAVPGCISTCANPAISMHLVAVLYQSPNRVCRFYKRVQLGGGRRRRLDGRPVGVLRLQAAAAWEVGAR